MLAAAQAAKPAGAAPLPKMIDTDQQVQDTISQEEAAREQEKLEQQRKKELEAKDNEIRGLRHELELEQVARERATNEYELDKKIRQEEDKLKGERDKLEKDRAQLVQEKARQNNILQAEQMRHQAELDKATFKQQAEIAKSQAKATADIARQQAQQYIRTTDQARKQSDKYYADASAKLKKQAPAISPALQSQLDGAINSLNTFKKVHQKQLAIPSPGTPPHIKMAHIKWASPTLPGTQTPPNTTPQPQASPSPTPSSSEQAAAAMRDRDQKIRQSRELAQRGIFRGQGAYDTSKLQAAYLNELYDQRNNGYITDQQYNALKGNVESVYQTNRAGAMRRGDKRDIANDNSYRDTRTVWGTNTDPNSWLPWESRQESAFSRDATAFERFDKFQDYNNNAGWFHKGYDFVLGDILGTPVVDLHNSVTNWAANRRNAGYYGANRSWFGDTTFSDPSMKDAYYSSLGQHGFSDNPWADLGATGLNALSTGLMFTGVGRLGGIGASAAMRGLGIAGGIGAGTAGHYLTGQQQKQASYIPTPGAPPVMLTKKADVATAHRVNIGFNRVNPVGHYYMNPVNNTSTGRLFQNVGDLATLLGFPSPTFRARKEHLYNKPWYKTNGLELATNVYQGTGDDARYSGYHKDISPVHRSMTRMVYGNRTGDTQTANGNWNGSVPAAKMNGGASYA